MDTDLASLLGAAEAAAADGAAIVARRFGRIDSPAEPKDAPAIG